MTDTTSAPTPAPASASSLSGLGKDIAWVHSHLIALAICALFIVGGVYGVESLMAKHDAENASREEAVLAAAQANTAVLQAQITKDEATWQQQMQTLVQENTALAKTISQRNTQTQQEVQKDATLSATDAAQRLGQQTKAGPGEVTAQGDNVILDLPVTRTVVANLDLLPAAQQNLADTQKQLENETQIATNATADVSAQKNLNASLQTQLTDQDKACKAEIKSVKSQARKGKIKAFFFGVATVFFGLGAHAI